MSSSTIAEIRATNNRVYENLLVSLEAAGEQVDLLIAVCDDEQVRCEVIERYATELATQDIQHFSVQLPRGEPSLRISLRELVEYEPELKKQKPVAVTVLGADQLSMLPKSKEARSEQDIFFGYLQLTRDGLGEFPLSVVLWVSHQVAKMLATQAPDFWSWRGGVFWFRSYRQVTVSAKELERLNPFLVKPMKLTGDSDDEYVLPIDDLQALIEQEKTDSQKLGELHYQLGELYRRRFERGATKNQEKERDLAFQEYYKSIEIYSQSADQQGLIWSYNSLGKLSRSCSLYQDAITAYQNSLDIARKIRNDLDESIILSNLGIVHNDLGQYRQAVQCYLQSLRISKAINDKQSQSYTLGYLGVTYKNLSEYQQAIDVSQQALAISRKVGNRDNEGIALGNLGSVYRKLGDYEQAISFHEQKLEIARELGDRAGEGYALGHLGSAYLDLGYYQQAIEYYNQDLALSQEINDLRGVGIAFGHLGDVYLKLGNHIQAIDSYEKDLAISREINDRRGMGIALGHLGNAYFGIGKYAQAVQFHQEKISIAHDIGDRYGKAMGNRDLGFALQKMNRPQEAINAYEEALRISDEVGLTHKVDEIEAALAELKLARVQYRQHDLKTTEECL